MGGRELSASFTLVLVTLGGVAAPAAVGFNYAPSLVATLTVSPPNFSAPTGLALGTADPPGLYVVGHGQF